MENSSSSHVMPTMSSIKSAFQKPLSRSGVVPLTAESSEDEKLKQLEGRLFIGSLSFRQKISAFGLSTALKSYAVRYRYMLGLWLLRESAMIMILSENYEKVQGLWSKILASPLVSSPLVTLYRRLSVRLLNRPDIMNLSVKVKTVNK